MKKSGLVFAIVIAIVFTVSCVNKEVPVTETYYETEYKTETYTTIEDVVINANEGATDLMPKSKWERDWIFDSSNCEVTPSSGGLVGWTTKYYGYDLSANQHSKSQIKITYQFSGFVFGSLDIFDLSDTGQIAPYEIGQGRWEERENETGVSCSIYIPTSQEEEWLKQWCIPENHLAVCLPGKTSYTFDSENIGQFAIILSHTSGAIVGSAKVLGVQLVWADQVTEKKTVIKERQVPYQVEKQRTVMQTERVPFWELIFH